MTNVMKISLKPVPFTNVSRPFRSVLIWRSSSVKEGSPAKWLVQALISNIYIDRLIVWEQLTSFTWNKSYNIQSFLRLWYFPHRKMTSLLRFSFVVDNLHCLLNAYYYVWRNHIKTIRTSHIMNYPPIFYVEYTKISVYVESPLSFYFFFWECSDGIWALHSVINVRFLILYRLPPCTENPNQWSLSGIHSSPSISHLILWNGCIFPADFTSVLESRRWTGNLQQKDYSKKQSISSFHLFLHSSYDLNILPYGRHEALIFLLVHSQN